MDEAIIRTQFRCYLCTSRLRRGRAGSFFGPTLVVGELLLSDRRLRFNGTKGICLSIDMDSIVEVSLGHYSRWFLPKLRYIAVKYHDATQSEQTVLLTPDRTWMTHTWETNRIVAEWLDLLLVTIDERRVATTTITAFQGSGDTVSGVDGGLAGKQFTSPRPKAARARA